MCADLSYNHQFYSEKFFNQMKAKKIRNIFYTVLLSFSTFSIVSAYDDMPFKPPGRFISIGFQTMYVDCLGNNAPTVLVDVGIAESSASWYKIAIELSKDVRICLYDRAGYGWSDPGRGERTTATIVHELKLLLKRAKFPAPMYWLVTLLEDLQSVILLPNFQKMS
jgi:pimeloyl-ACP methyl ester carboxylesterase